MPDGGRLTITGRPVSGGIEILFQDSGPGVPTDQQKNIFEPFFSTKEGGTGLGLTVSYNIVTAHGGTLELLTDAMDVALVLDYFCRQEATNEIQYSGG